MIRIGPCGWAYKDWDGIVYPTKKPKGFDRLAFLAQYFNAIEIDTSFYGPPPAAWTKKWSESIKDNKRFRFTAKLYKTFTHSRDASAEDEANFKEGMAPLMEEGRLGALLLQFPWSFKNTAENRSYVVGLHRRFRDFPLVLEVRHDAWAVPETLDLLADLDIGLCNIDQPLFDKSVKPAAEATSSLGYVRLHGRNYSKWFSPNAQSHERYDYLYTPKELEPWVERIEAISRKTKDTYAMSNNHHVGKAITNSLEITSMLTGKPVSAPALLVEHYPELSEFTR